MILTNLIGFVAFVCNSVSTLGETCGIIPTELLAFTIQLKENITKLLIETNLKWNKYSKLLEFLCNMLKQNNIAA